MHRYEFEVLSADGSVLTGSLNAVSELDAARQLERKGLTPLNLRLPRGTAVLPRRRRLTMADLLLALEELVTMLKAGVSIADAVAAQQASAHHLRIAEAFGRMATHLRRGEAFSDCLAHSGLPLPLYMLQLARAGELSGHLSEAMSDGLKQMAYEHESEAEIRNALIYPSILMVAGALAVLLVFFFVVPKFASLLNRSDQLPWLAWAVLAGGRWASEHGWELLIGVAVVVITLFRALQAAAVRERGMNLLQRLPGIGDWLGEAETALWAKITGALLGNRVALIAALELAATGIRFPQRRQRMAQVVRAVRDGVPLSDALEEQAALNATGCSLVRVGERAGELPAMLQALFRLYDDAGRKRMKRLLILIEPIAVLVIGSLIGTLILGVVLAITSANELVL